MALAAVSQVLNAGGAPSVAEAKILGAFDSAWVVVLGENHGHLEFHDLVLRVLSSPGAARAIDDVAVEWGNALYQGVVDRYTFFDPGPGLRVRPKPGQNLSSLRGGYAELGSPGRRSPRPIPAGGRS